VGRANALKHDDAHDDTKSIKLGLHRVAADLTHHLADRIRILSRIAIRTRAKVRIALERDPGDLDVFGSGLISDHLECAVAFARGAAVGPSAMRPCAPACDAGRRDER
jgi:hypothetical protein